jgi:hypothetical protein
MARPRPSQAQSENRHGFDTRLLARVNDLSGLEIMVNEITFVLKVNES